MKITHLASASVLIQHKNTKILTDPWLVGDEYYGSWSHYPKLDLDLSKLDDLDYIYVSHIHGDHMSIDTIKQLNKDIPILIHNYDSKFVKGILERMGRKVIELDHGEEFHCGDGLNIRIYAADDCDPEVCFKFFGCGKMETKFGSTGIDTMAVIENGDKAILNVNDCPYILSQKVLNRVLSDFPKIDLLLVGYAGAGSYPQCWQNYTDESKLKIHGIKKKNHFLNMGLDFLKRVKPVNYMPFAGTYTLKGKRANLERYRVVPELQDALKFYQDNYDGHGFLLNSEQSFDLETQEASAKYVPTNYEEKIKYVEEVLSKFKYEYEDDPSPSLQEILDLIPKCFERYEDKRKEIKFQSDTSVLLTLPENNYCKISCKGEGFKILNQEEFDLALLDPHVTYELDFKLLKRILSGPKYAHWNNAEVGSHIMFSRNPDTYERGLYYSMNYFHS